MGGEKSAGSSKRSSSSLPLPLPSSSLPLSSLSLPFVPLSSLLPPSSPPSPPFFLFFFAPPPPPPFAEGIGELPVPLLLEGTARGSLFLALLREEEERERADRSREESERTFSAIFRSSPVANLLTSMPEGAVLDANEVFLRDMRYAREEVVGRTVRELGVFQTDRDLGDVLVRMKEQGAIYGRE